MLQPRLNTDTRPIADKYREGKLKRTLKRGLKVRETAQREADGATKSDRLIQRSVGIMRGQPRECLGCLSTLVGAGSHHCPATHHAAAHLTRRECHDRFPGRLMPIREGSCGVRSHSFGGGKVALQCYSPGRGLHWPRETEVLGPRLSVSHPSAFEELSRKRSPGRGYSVCRDPLGSFPEVPATFR